MSDTPNKTPIRFHLRDVRVAFPNLTKPGKFGYGCRFILPPDHVQVVNAMSREYCKNIGVTLPVDLKAKVKTISLLEAIAKAVAKAKWQDKGPSIYAALAKQDKVFLHDGDTKSDLDGFSGNYFVSAGARSAVSVFDQLRNEATEAQVYAGCFAVASLDFWAQDNTEGGKRLNCSVYGVQKLRDSDAFGSGGKPADADEFENEDISEEGEEIEVDLES